MAEVDTDVVIVGAGPAGLALATELTMRGRTVTVLERGGDTGVQPRAKTTNVRSMTHMRRWGLAGTVRERSPLRPDFPRRVSFQLSPFSPPIFDFEDAFCASPRRREEFPEHAEFIPQYVIGRILGEHVGTHPRARIDFGATVTGFVEDGDRVRVDIDTAGGPRSVTARYVVGADGARSTIRKHLGIRMTGQSDIARLVTLILRIPGLVDDPDLHGALFHWILNPEATSFLGPMDVDDLWFFGTSADHDTDTEVLLAKARRAIGRDAFEPTVVTRDDWTVHSLIADSYRKGRAFLIGDACHLHSPFGGHGMNLGIADAVDLGWKLSARLDGWGTESLLDSYEIERRQAHQAVIESATINVATLSEHYANSALAQDGPAGDAARARAAEAIEIDKSPEFRSLGLVLGYRYSGSPALAPDDRPADPIEISHYRPCARPGHLAPHAWVNGATSLYDLFGPVFTFLDLGEGPSGLDEILDAARSQGIPLTVRAMESVKLDRLYGVRFALIRPDQHIAWSGDTLLSPDAYVSLMRGEAMALRTEPA